MTTILYLLSYPCLYITKTDNHILHPLVPGDCTLPETMPSGMTIQDDDDTFYSEGAIFNHNTVLNFNCPEVSY